MKVIETGIEGLKIIELQKFEDERGFFMEKFNCRALKENGVDFEIKQVNHSFSVKGVLRGLHFQTNPWQGKIVGCVGGIINDVAVDLRRDSKTFGKHFVLKIEDDSTMLLVPYGFAHGFEVLSDSAHLLYFADGLYDGQSDGGVRYDSCQIEWEVKNPIVSPKDLTLQTFEQYCNNL